MDTFAKSNEPAGFPETEDIHTSSDEYAGRFAGRHGAWMLEVQERIALGYLKQSGAKTVLDVGGGHGQLAHPMVRDGYTVTVLGSAPECEHRIRDLTAAGTCTYLVGNVIALPFPDKSFDAVVCFRLLTHCGQWPKLIEELCRVARTAIVVDYPTGQSLNAVAPALFEAKKKYEKNTRRWTLFRHDEIFGEFAKNRWHLAKRTGQFFFPMIVHRMLKMRAFSAFLEGTSRILGLNGKWGTPVIAWLKPGNS